MSAEDWAGQVLGGRYKLLKKLGEGGFADVYKAEHINLGKLYAIKILKAYASAKEITLFFQEARIIASLSHEHIVQVFDFDNEEKRLYFVMQYVSGGSLRDKSFPLPLTTVVDYTLQIASALQYAHDREYEYDGQIIKGLVHDQVKSDGKTVKGLVHCDIKPDNVLLAANDKILVSDFGVASLTSSHLYNLEHAAGDMRYMAPEHIGGHPCRASDQYSLAVTVYELLCEQPPFIGGIRELLSQHYSVQPPSLCKRIPGLPQKIEDVIFRALAKNPDDRYPTIMEFAQALEQASLLPGESYYPAHVALAMRERYYGQFTSAWSGQQDYVMRDLGEPEEITQEIAKERISCHEKRTTGYIRPFSNGYICWSERGGAQHIWLGFADIFKREGGIEGYLGFPLNYEERAAPSPNGTTGVFQRFEGRWDYPEDINTPPARCGASMYYSEKYGAHPITGGISVCYERLHGTGGKLGFPTSATQDAGPSLHGTKGRYKCFEGGFIYWSQKTHAHPVWGDIGVLYHDLEGAKGRLGFPLSDEEKVISSFGTEGVCQRFEGGPSDGLPIGDEWDFSKGIFVYWSKHGTYPVWGGPHIRYEAMGGPQSFLGFPISMERKAGDSPQGTEGWYQDFESGCIHWTDTYGGIPILGDICRVYGRFDGSRGKFGFPIAPEEVVEGQLNMRMQQFEGGVICVMREDVA